MKNNTEKNKKAVPVQVIEAIFAVILTHGFGVIVYVYGYSFSPQSKPYTTFSLILSLSGLTVIFIVFIVSGLLKRDGMLYGLIFIMALNISIVPVFTYSAPSHVLAYYLNEKTEIHRYFQIAPLIICFFLPHLSYVIGRLIRKIYDKKQSAAQ